ncbi:MAG: FtsX-like permease family protein [Candidatus Omnitrophica bacterium]|nr:FtsX-like permease family protein [Candidatus Omnitrophota bacterium]MCM8789048.1 FtsX-like permease family protein [Candidatus Omnitrophota bacterium]
MSSKVPEKKKIEKQLVLPLSHAFNMSLRSIKIRFGRSIIVTSSIVLGIAFLMSILSSNAFIAGIMQKGPESLKIALQQNLEEMRTRQIWLVSLSLLVCIVGIVNAMLMAVTERSREIGTMKCLGALDKFIVELFLLESSIQGLAGSIIGVLVGTMATFFIYFLRYKGLVWSIFPGELLIKYSVFSVLLGIVISVIGAIYPAYVSAKLEPAEAIRREV